MSKYKFQVELTYDEALVLALAASSGVSGGSEGGISSVIENIGLALMRADSTLRDAQYEYWQRYGEPNYRISDELPLLGRDGEPVIPL